jgi:hypothetical protein
MMKIFNKTKSDKGSVLLISLIVSTVVLAVGFGVYQRTYKEILLSSMWIQTQIAFGAADAGLECAVYWDLHPGAKSCFGTSFAWNIPNDGTWYVPDTLLAPFGNCVLLRAMKTPASPTVTTIEARGRNGACGSSNPRLVERGLKITY